MRRIIECASVFLLLLFTIFQGWHFSEVSNAVLIIVPIGGVVFGISSITLLRAEKNHRVKEKNGREEKQESKKEGSAEETKADNISSARESMNNRLTEHLVNAIILILFFISALIMIIMTVAKLCAYQELIDYCTVLTIIFLSLELAALLYHILRLIYIDNLPNEEIGQVLKIFKSLDD